jgi:hypothetical protein
MEPRQVKQIRRVRKECLTSDKKDKRAVMLFGRAFEISIGAYFLQENAAAALSGRGIFPHGIQLLERLCPKTIASVCGSHAATCGSSSHASAGNLWGNYKAMAVHVAGRGRSTPISEYALS